MICDIYDNVLENHVAQLIDMEMKSADYTFKLNIRDTAGKDGLPNRMMCDFSYNK